MVPGMDFDISQIRFLNQRWAALNEVSAAVSGRWRHSIASITRRACGRAVHPSSLSMAWITYIIETSLSGRQTKLEPQS
jgi:hypothetical protein